MACYIISYDVQKDFEYEKLYDRIKSYGTWAKINKSTWAVVTDLSAVQVRNDLLTVLSEGDSLFVVKSGVAAAWVNVACSSEWLKKYL